MEAEALTPLPTSHSAVENPTLGTRGEGDSGGQYLRTTRNFFGQPGNGILSAEFTVASGGEFQFAKRSRIGVGGGGTDHNDTWVRLIDSNGQHVNPISNNDVVSGQAGWLKSYQKKNGDQGWSYQSSNRDTVGRSISWNLADNGSYTLQVSARSDVLLIARVFLWDRSMTQFANAERGFEIGQSAARFSALRNSSVEPDFLLGDVNQDEVVSFFSQARERNGGAGGHGKRRDSDAAGRSTRINQGLLD